MGQTTPAGRLYAIVELGLCIGCGICEAVAGADTVRCTNEAYTSTTPKEPTS